MSQVTALMPEGRQRYFNNDGTPCAGGKLWTYAAGTSNPKTTYADADGTIANPNPVPLDAKGEAVIFWNGAYKVDLKQANGLQVTGYPVDNLKTDPAGLWTIFTRLLTGAGASLLGFIQSGAGAVVQTVQAALRERFTVTQFGAVAGQDATAAFAAALAALPNNGELIVPAGVELPVTSIRISGKSNFSIRIDGKIKNTSPKANAAASDQNTAVRGVGATFYITDCHNFKIYGAGVINPGYREAFCIGENLPASTSAPCTDFDISIDVVGDGINDNIHANRVRYCSRFSIREMRLDALTAKPAWAGAGNRYYYNWAETLLLWDCTDFTLRGLKSRNNGMNGIYVGSNCERFAILDCDLEHNAGSGVQLAWSSFGIFPRYFQISGNRAKFNRADGFDINNTGDLLDVHGTITGNLGYYNGWGTEDTSCTAPTNDGSGIGTYVNLKKVTVTDNMDVECSRTGCYMERVWDANVRGNRIYKVAPTSNGDGLYFLRCTNIMADDNNVNVIAGKKAFSMYGDNATQGNVKASGNYLNGQVYYDGGAYPSCLFNGNKVISPAQINMPADCLDNEFTITGAGQSGIYALRSGMTIARNKITAPNFGVICFSFDGVKVTDNDVTGDGGIRVDTCNGTVVRGNTAHATNSPGIHVLGPSDSTEVSMNASSSTAGNSYRVEAACTNTNKWGNRNLNGPPSWTGTFGINF